MRNSRRASDDKAGKVVDLGLICVFCVICGSTCLPDRTASFARWQTQLFLGVV
jgi:hypothetical protein